MIVFPDAPQRPLQFILQRKGARTLKEADQWSVYANPYDGEVVSWRRREGSGIAWLRDLHFALFAGVTGLLVNGWMALVLTFISNGSGSVLSDPDHGRGVVPSGSTGPAHGSGRCGTFIAWEDCLALVLLTTAALSGAYYWFRETVTRLLVSAAGALRRDRRPPVGAARADAVPLDRRRGCGDRRGS